MSQLSEDTVREIATEVSELERLGGSISTAALLCIQDGTSVELLRQGSEGKTLLSIRSSDGPMLSIDGDGQLTYGPDYEPDEAARHFWEAMAQLGSVRRAFAKFDADDPIEEAFGPDGRLKTLIEIAGGVERAETLLHRSLQQEEVAAS